MQKIGEDVSERLEFIPASLQVIEEVLFADHKDRGGSSLFASAHLSRDRKRGYAYHRTCSGVS
jgi:hypothetical protein